MCVIESVTLVSGALSIIHSINVNLNMPTRYRNDLLALQKSVIEIAKRAEANNTKETRDRSEADGMLRAELEALTGRYNALQARITNERKDEVACMGQWFACMLRPWKIATVVLGGVNVAIGGAVVYLDHLVRTLQR